MMSFDDFKKIDLRVAKIIAAERIPDSQKLIKLQVDLGADQRQIVAGIGEFYEPEKLIGREIIIVANLEPKTFLGAESQGMLLAANDGRPVLIMPEHEVRPGSPIS